MADDVINGWAQGIGSGGALAVVTCALFLIGVLSGSAGVGGGGLNVPLLMFALKLPIEDAIVLSHGIILGSMVAQNAVNLTRRHPHDADRPLVDFVAPLLLLPAQLAGSAIGLALRTLFPSGLLVTLSVGLLCTVALKVGHKGREMLRHEPAVGDGMRACHDCMLAAAQPARPWSALRTCGGLPWRHVLVLAAFLACFVIDLLLLGGELKLPLLARATPCSAQYWFFVLLGLPLSALAASFGLAAVGRTSREGAPSSDDPAWRSVEEPMRDDAHSPFAHAELRHAAILPLAASCVGFVSALVGVGGGELVAPLCMALGMPTEVAVATSSFIILVCEVSNVVHYSVTESFGRLADLAVVLATCACAGALLGRLLSIAALHLGYESVPVLVLATMLASSAGLLLVRAGTTGLLFSSDAWRLGPLCGT